MRMNADGVTDGPVRRILFVEDDAIVLEPLTRLLRKKGFSVDTACNGHTGLVKVRANPVYDLIITDVVMPRMDGINFLSKIGEKRTAVLVYSAVVDISSVESLLAEKGVPLTNLVALAKPCSTEKFFDAITSLLDGRSVRSQTFPTQSAVSSITSCSHSSE